MNSICCPLANSYMDTVKVYAERFAKRHARRQVSILLWLNKGDTSSDVAIQPVISYSDGAEGCLSRYLGMAELIHDNYDSHRTFKRATAIVASQFQALKPVG